MVVSISGRALCIMPQERASQGAITNRDRSQVRGHAVFPTSQTDKLCQWEFPQGRSYLTSHIEADDALPIGWNPLRRRRLSEGDLADLQEHLEMDHNLRQVEPRRPSELDPSTHFDSDLQEIRHALEALEPYSKARQAEQRRALEFNPPTPVRDLDPSTSVQTSQRWTQNAARTLSVWSNSSQRRTAVQISGFAQWLKASARELFTAMLYFLHDCLRTARQVLKISWTIVKWPSALLVSLLVLLNGTALAYTVTHEAFLSSFCAKDLSLVRDWIYSAWDQRQQSGKGIVKAGRFTDPLEGILLRNGSVSSYMLPHILGRYETIVRGFEVNLSVS